MSTYSPSRRSSSRTPARSISRAPLFVSLAGAGIDVGVALGRHERLRTRPRNFGQQIILGREHRLHPLHEIVSN